MMSCQRNNQGSFMVAAYLAHPYLEIPANLLKKNISDIEVQQTLLTNRVMFRSLMRLDSSADSRKNVFISRLAKDNTEMQERYEFARTLKNELLDAIELLNTNNVQTVFIKSPKILPLDSDNFDLLVRDDQIKMTDEVLRANGFSSVSVSKEPYKSLYRKTREGKDYLALHIHSRVAWAGIEFLKTEDVWKKHRVSTVEGRNVGFVSPEHHVLVTLAHAFFENASLKLSELMYLADSLNNNEIDLRVLISSSSRMGWDVAFSAMLLFANSVHHDIFGVSLVPADKLDAILLETLSSDRLARVNDLVGRMKAQYLKQCLPVSLGLRNYRIRQLVSQVYSNHSLSRVDKARRLTYLLSIFSRGIYQPQKPPMKVCFIGVDSAGKTTHAKNLADAFRKRGYHASYFWSRGAFHLTEPFTRLAALLLGASSSASTHRKISVKRVKQVKTNPLFGKFLTLLLIFEYAVQLSAKSLLGGFSSNVYVFDRYLHDTVIDSLLAYGQDYNSFFSRFLLNRARLFVPQPDLVFLLKVSPSAVVKRRPEEDFEAIRLKSEVYEQWSTKWDANVVDTERYSVEQNRLLILERALRLFYEGRNRQ